MGIKNLLRTRATSIEETRRNEIATVRVPDIKQYLVQEYERSQMLFQQNEDLKEELKKGEEVQLKYNATLVTLAEYDARLKRYEAMIKSRDEEILNCKDNMNELRDELNDYKIRFSRASITKEEIKQEVIDETKEAIIKAISSHKGNLSKSCVLDLVRKAEQEEERVGGEE